MNNETVMSQIDAMSSDQLSSDQLNSSNLDSNSMNLTLNSSESKQDQNQLDKQITKHRRSSIN